ncbi:hypothetical protein K437DRAFT_69739 [Tilletiaria anomala UBC 951]|uniref:Zn(2)-C6 fungal-type domain-containing protein n=1 Tax=Tilletiaria anomala (strain ATCC 24038 / CBS 436.72 / UBC 951) TaxID=1037660 RepID=A0A066WQX1_TILAU|nr:uncharacterized protein K437DRAFT_69739 [Tilletiaria anomala UBC 951]KDN53384.1 hypothetical protein K437DRAFT_69739 [Tilletiaria anomala UBC 951]
MANTPDANDAASGRLPAAAVAAAATQRSVLGPPLTRFSSIHQGGSTTSTAEPERALAASASAPSPQQQPSSRPSPRLSDLVDPATTSRYPPSLPRNGSGSVSNAPSFPFPPLPSPYANTTNGARQLFTSSSATRSPALYKLASSERSTVGELSAASSAPAAAVATAAVAAASPSSAGRTSLWSASVHSRERNGASTGPLNNTSASSPGASYRTGTTTTSLSSSSLKGKGSSSSAQPMSTLIASYPDAYQHSGVAPASSLLDSGDGAAGSISPSYGFAHHGRRSQAVQQQQMKAQAMYTNGPDATSGSSSCSNGVTSSSSRGLKRPRSPRPPASAAARSLHAETHAKASGHESSPSERGSSSPAGGNNSTSTSTKNRAGDGADAPTSKKPKTPRACDSCRTKKIKCQVLKDGLCLHCKTYQLRCTFYLPISETRFKKKRDREMELFTVAAAAAAAAATGRAPLTHVPGARGLGAPHDLSGRILPPLRPSMSQEWSAPPGTVPQAAGFTAWPSSGPRSAPVLAGDAHLAAAAAGNTGSNSSPERAAEPSRAATGPAVVVALQRSASESAARVCGVAANGGHSPASGAPPQPPDSSVLGPTSIAYLVHSTAFVPSAALEDHDIKHHQTFEVGASGDGIIKFHKVPRTRGSVSSDEELPTELPEVVRSRLAGDVAEKLVNSYFERIAPMFPIITKSEFLHLSPPPPLLLYAVCSVAALARDVPREVLTAVRSTLAILLRDSDVLSNSSSVAIRALLVMSLHQDVHGSTAVQCGARSWNRLGCAVRMAQDLGLHRDASGRDDVDGEAFFLEQKRRVWGSCVTADRWAAIYSGRPLAIDLTDCDVRLPSPYEVLRYPSDPPSRPGEQQPFVFNTEMLKLSILFGRVMKTIYSPTGLMKATDEEITSLLGDIDAWREALPERLQFKGQRSPPEAGILHIAHACLQVLFFRVFLRISYVCPTHLKFSMTIERMTQLLTWAKEAIDWVNDHDFYFDTLGLLSYSLVSCATLMYHASIRRGDQVALEKLKKLRDYFKAAARTDEGLGDSVRAKSGAVIALLYDAAIGAFPNERYTGALNPTAGVSNHKTTEAVRGLKFKPDPSRPGGGVYVAETSDLVVHDLPRGTVILKDTETANRMPVFTWSPTSGNWRMVSGNPDSAPLPADDPSSAPGAKLVTMFPMATGLVNLPPGMPQTPQQQQQQLPPQPLQQQQPQVHHPQHQEPAGMHGFPVDVGDVQAQLFANVNPDLNGVSWNPAANFVLESSADLAPNLQGSGVDPLLLDGLPQHLDFDAWSSWFARFQPHLQNRDSDMSAASLAV